MVHLRTHEGLRMTATAKAPPKETWAKWIPRGAIEPPLVTRDELIRRLSVEGIAVNYRNLEHWQLRGVIPYPVRRRHQGATKALYPEWMIDAIKHLRDAQSRGLSLDEIAPLIRAWAFTKAKIPWPLTKEEAEVRAALASYARAYEQRGANPIYAVSAALLDEDGQVVHSFGGPIHRTESEP